MLEYSKRSNEYIIPDPLTLNWISRRFQLLIFCQGSVGEQDNLKITENDERERITTVPYILNLRLKKSQDITIIYCIQ